MVTYVSRSKDRIFHPRFLACMNHYVMEPSSIGLEPMAPFWTTLYASDGLGSRMHPEQKDQTIDAVFELEQAELRPLGHGFDGYVEKAVRVRSTCLVQYDSNRYSVPAQYAGRHISLRACAGRVVLVADQKVIAEHKRRFTKNISYFEPWHYVPLLSRKPGALRDGAPFVEWQLPQSMMRIKTCYMNTRGGDRDFVELLMLVQEHGIDVVELACERAVEQNTLRLPAIINLINQLVEPVISPLPQTHRYPQLQVMPEADCKRYEALYAAQEKVA